MALDPLAERGFADNADDYDRGRPGWPPPVVDAAFERLRLDRSATVVDVGAGTGRLTRELADRSASVVAVEPSPAMRARLERSLPELPVLAGTAEALPLADGAADAVLCAESFHWFRSADALREIARVLKPGGGLALVWNARRPELGLPPWAGELLEIIARHPPEGLRFENRYESGQWRAGFEETDLFEPLEMLPFDHVQRLDADGFVAQVRSWSFVGALPPAERDEVAREVFEMLARRGVTELEIPYRTELHVSRVRKGRSTGTT